MYIPEKCITDIKNINDMSQITDISDQVQSFINDTSKKSMLIQGGAGTGKTIYCQYLITQLLESKNIIPILISLPQLQNFETQMIEQSLKELRLTDTEINNLQISKIPLLFIIDGFDEIRSYKCLYNTNNLINWNCKTIFTCRSSHLAGDPAYYKYFISSKFDRQLALQEAILVHFDEQQVNDYLQRFVEKQQANKNDWNDWKLYRSNINQIPGLLELVKNPFILSMIVAVLPKLVDQREQQQKTDQLISLDLYEAFVKNWFENEEQRMYQNNIVSEITNLQIEYEDYSLKLATQMMDDQKTVVYYDSTDKNSKWKNFFDPNNQKIVTIRRGSLLNVSTKYYSFIHKTILEYFVVKEGQRQVQQIVNQLNTQKSGIQDKLINCSFNKRIITDLGVFSFYTEAVQRYPVFKSQLYQLIELSKTTKEIQTAAANAITILNYSNEHFINADFKNISIPGANLSAAVLCGTDFTSANLSEVDFQCAWLNNTIFNNANMNNVEFGQMVYIDQYTFFNCTKAKDLIACCNKFSEQLAVFDFKCQQVCLLDAYTDIQRDDMGYIHVLGIQFCFDDKYLHICFLDTIKVYSTNNWELVNTIKLDAAMQSVSYSSDNKYVVFSCNEDILLYQLDESNKLLLLQKIHAHDFQFGQIFVQFSPNNNILTADSTVLKLWDINLKLIKEIEFSSDKQFFCFSYDGNYLAGTQNCDIHIWNAKTFELITVLKGHNGIVDAIEFSPDGQYLATGDREGVIMLWDSKFELIKTIGIHAFEVSRLMFAGDVLISSSNNQQIKFSMLKSKNITKQQESNKLWTEQAIFSPNFKYFVTADREKVVLWDFEKGTILQTFFDKHSNSKIFLSNKWLMIVTNNNDSESIQTIWNIQTEKFSAKIIEFQIKTGQFSKNQDEITLAENDKIVNFNLETLQKSVIVENSQYIQSFCYKDDYSMFAFSDYDSIYIHNTNSGKLEKIITTNCGFTRIIFKDNIIYATEYDSPPKIWNIRGEEQQVSDKDDELYKILHPFEFNDQGLQLKKDYNCVCLVENKRTIKIFGEPWMQLKMNQCSIQGAQNISPQNQSLIQQLQLLSE
ncbi:WD40_repeat protein [Hexamita inflata]|uniref:WD40 repeat protein n=1 Tax=Hexamita inflata TaxID=28002 RepID=A0AA86RE88_9EUKA|nr:WD40 repeat protein [Hexamita inflata]